VIGLDLRDNLLLLQPANSIGLIPAELDGGVVRFRAGAVEEGF
jgi:hypothetical protein